MKLLFVAALFLVIMDVYAIQEKRYIRFGKRHQQLFPNKRYIRFGKREYIPLDKRNDLLDSEFLNDMNENLEKRYIRFGRR
uniref:Secreted peptide prohormone-11 n=1 Tax=Schmidtea mediterranea TaxID=79327 RepID=E3CTI9_SCHMD|nr:TPA_inf: secreted peptide prohormone-11 [Schmidtea mediterranea]